MSSSYAHNRNKPFITPYTPNTTSRVLSECDLYMPNNDNDPYMKSVKENFDRQTSRRFEEYEERMITQRQKYKEQRDKDIQKIVLKDKMEKSLEEKIEKGCLKCGCGLGGVAAGIGIIGPIAISELKKAAAVAAAQKGIQAGIAKAIKGLEEIYGLSQFSYLDWHAMVTATTYYQPMELVEIVNSINSMCTESNPAFESLFCKASYAINSEGTSSSFTQTISQMAAKAAAAAGEAAESAKKAQIALANAESTYLYSAIGYSVLAILIIVLILVIIYLILRYRRKKKMKIKQQYTKLLNQ
ncbi:hypothetical protein PFDG_02073 [Plasmodium falciparum Dd2]|uniref:Rifin n=1 Tax=Plasmodium falciparum (isolate Dd2) TaxID=57267 RepID=A0A0L7M0M2_PLAF4|nr:hypothetical protein PFDG_02073 [Plasmodium falciparum Dd2]